MKPRYCWICSLGLGLLALPFAGRLAQEASGEPTNTLPVITPETQSNAVAEAMADQTADTPEPTAEVDLADAVVQPLSAERPLPPGVKPTAPVAEVIRLAESGVDEGVMLAFVTNSVSAFNLTADDIIYLNDIGVPASVVTAMIQRDQALQGVSTNVPPAMIAGPTATAPTNQYAPVPEMAAPAPSEPAATRASEEMPVEAPVEAPAEVPVEAPPPTEYAQADYAVPLAAAPVYSTFYSALTPYGSWVDVSGYGPCWQPTVVVSNPNWQPYFDGGRWVYSDCGWYWLSDYSWGWAPFHYGRWFRHNRIGWCWAPGRVWGPSWVCWRYTTTHCGWAPLPPGAYYRHGTGLMFRGKPAGSTCAFGLGPRSFAVVPFNRFWDRQLPRHAVSHTQASQLLSRSVASSAFVAGNNRIMNNGLPPSRVVAATRTGLHRVAIRESNATATPGMRAERLEANGSRLSIAHPNLPQRTTTQPTSVERARTGSRHGSGSVVAGPTAPRSAPSQSLRPPSGAAAPQPASAERPATREGRRPAESTTAAKPATVAPAQTAAGSAAPPVLHGRSRSSEGARNSSGSAATEALPRGALVFSGRQDHTTATTHGQTPEARPQSLPSQPTATRYPSTSPTEMGPRPQTRANVASEAQRPSFAARSAPSPAPIDRQDAAPESRSTQASRPAAVPTYTPSRTFTGNRDLGQRTTSAQPPRATARTFASQPSVAQYQASPRPETSQRPQIQTRVAAEVQRPSYTAQPSPAPVRVERQYTAPAPRAVEAPRPAPAPSYTPQRSYSPPAAAPAQRSAAPSYSAPASRPSHSPAASSQNSSSGRRGR